MKATSFCCAARGSTDTTCKVTRTLDSDGQLALVLRAGAGYTAGDDFRTLRNIFAQFHNILIIDVLNAVNAKAANLLAAPSLGAAASFASFGSFGSFQSAYLLIQIRSKRQILVVINYRKIIGCTLRKGGACTRR